MSLTEHEVGHVPSATPAQPPFGGSALILSIIGIVLLSMMGSPVGLAVGIVLLFINGHRYRIVGIVGTALSGTILVTTIAYFAIIFGVVAHTAAAPVATTAPVATVSAPQPTTPAVVLPAPDALPTNPVETGPIQPVASTPEGTIRAVEAYRNQAYQTGDTAPLAYYFALGVSPKADLLYRLEAARVNTIKPDHLVGQASESVTKVEMISATPSMMVAHVTIKETVSGVVKTTITFRSVYVVVGGRWLVRSFANDVMDR